MCPICERRHVGAPLGEASVASRGGWIEEYSVDGQEEDSSNHYKAHYPGLTPPEPPAGYRPLAGGPPLDLTLFDQDKISSASRAGQAGRIRGL